MRRETEGLSIGGKATTIRGCQVPSSSVRSNFGPEEMEAAYVAASAEVIPTGREPLTATETRIEFDHLWLTRTYESAPSIRYLALKPTRAFISFLTQPGPEVTIRGTAMPATGMMRHSREHAYYERTSGPTHWGTISMPVDDMIAAGEMLGGYDLRPPRDPTIVTPPSEALADFHRLHAAVGALADTAPSVIADPEAARGLEQSLVELMVHCLGDAAIQRERWAQQCHSTVMRRFRGLLQDHPDRAIYVPEICAAIGVPERTLRHCCQEQLGMSPKQYLSLRRLRLVHRALRAASPGETTVTEVATRYGFWHFGRFAGCYRSVFGEPPSATLNNARNE